MTKGDKKIKKQNHHRRSLAHPSENITIGNISGGTGIAIGTSAKAVVNQYSGDSTDQIAATFKILAQAVSLMSEGPNKVVAENAVAALELEARKGNEADETKIQKWMNFLLETAPDAWEVAIDVFTNPLKGIGTVFRKVAAKAKNLQGKKEANQTK